MLYNDQGASAVDALGNEVTVTSIDNININILGQYQVTYTATDSYGNTQTAIRTVNVVDLAGPIILLNGDNPMTVELNSTYVEPGATAYDRINLEEELTNEAGDELNPDLEPGINLNNRNLSVTITGIVDTSVPGTYIRTYSATDSQNNTTSITKTLLLKIIRIHYYYFR